MPLQHTSTKRDSGLACGPGAFDTLLDFLQKTETQTEVIPAEEQDNVDQVSVMILVRAALFLCQHVRQASRQGGLTECQRAQARAGKEGLEHVFQVNQEALY